LFREEQKVVRVIQHDLDGELGGLRKLQWRKVEVNYNRLANFPLNILKVKLG
jgi:hypothetical protein